MSAFKKVAGLVAGVSAVTAIGVAVAQGVPPNPFVSNPALGAGEQTVNVTPIGETGVLAWGPQVVQTASLTKETEKAAVASETQPSQPVAQAPAQSDTTVAQAAPAPSNDNNTNAMGAGPAPKEEAAPVRAPRHDRG